MPLAVMVRPAGRALFPAAMLQACAAVLLALAVRLVGLNALPFVDELYNVLAAQAWLDTGTLVIDGGFPYTRAKPYTLLVATMFRWWGEGLVQARIPSVATGALLVGVMFLWVRWVAGRAAAWLTAGLLALDPLFIGLSQIGRFYMLHVLLFWLGAMALYAIRAPHSAATHVRSRMRAPTLCAAATLAFVGSLAMHDLSAIGIGLVLIWFAADGAGTGIRWLRSRGRAVRLVVGAGVALSAIAFLAFDGVDFIGTQFQRYRSAPLWGAGGVDQWRFYHWWLKEEYGPLWPLLPALATVAVFWRPRPTSFLAWLTVGAFLAQSLAAAKTERYLAYAMPAFFALSAIAIVRLVALARGPFLAGVERTFGGIVTRPIASLGFAALVVATGLAVVDKSRAAHDTALILMGDIRNRPLPYTQGDWESAVPVLAPLVRDASVVVSSSDVKALYFLGRLDYHLSAHGLYEGEHLPEFTRSRPAGRPAVRSAAALARIRSCYPTGLVVIDWGHARNPAFVGNGAMNWIEKNTRRVPLDGKLKLQAFQWDEATGAAEFTGDCPPRVDSSTLNSDRAARSADWTSAP